MTVVMLGVAFYLYRGRLLRYWPLLARAPASRPLRRARGDRRRSTSRSSRRRVSLPPDGPRRTAAVRGASPTSGRHKTSGRRSRCSGTGSGTRDRHRRPARGERRTAPDRRSSSTTSTWLRSSRSGRSGCLRRSGSSGVRHSRSVRAARRATGREASLRGSLRALVRRLRLRDAVLRRVRVRTGDARLRHRGRSGLESPLGRRFSLTSAGPRGRSGGSARPFPRQGPLGEARACPDRRRPRARSRLALAAAASSRVGDRDPYGGRAAAGDRDRQLGRHGRVLERRQASPGHRDSAGDLHERDDPAWRDARAHLRGPRRRLHLPPGRCRRSIRGGSSSRSRATLRSRRRRPCRSGSRSRSPARRPFPARHRSRSSGRATPAPARGRRSPRRRWPTDGTFLARLELR